MKPSRRRLSIEALECRRVLANLLVTTELDTVDPSDGVVSLREAINQANENGAEADVITFAPSLDGVPLQVTRAGTNENQNADGDLDLRSGPITLRGNGMERTIISGGGDTGVGEGVFHLIGSVDVIMEALTIRDGRATAGLAMGGAIADETDVEGSLRLERVRLTANQATNDGGGVFGSESSSITIVDSIIDHNTAARGGGIASLGGLTLQNTTIDSNDASDSGGGVYLRDVASTVFVKASTISNNEAGVSGGGLANVRTWVEITNTTFSGNRAIEMAGAVLTTASGNTVAGTSLSFSTITNNTTTSSETGVVHSRSESERGVAFTNIRNSILVGNEGKEESSNITLDDFDQVGEVRFTSNGGNVFDDSAIGIGIESDQLNVTQQVINATLADNGGSVATHALVFGSPAIDHAASGESKDARGFVRGVAATDSGAFAIDTPTVFARFDRPEAEEGGVFEIRLLATATAFHASDLVAAGPITLSNIQVDGTQSGDTTLSGTTMTLDGTTATRNSITEALLINVLDDDLVEAASESVSFEIDSVSGIPTANLNFGVQSFTIADNDRSEITLGDVMVGESDGTATVPITLSKPVDVAVEIGLRTFDGTAVAGTDYEGISGNTVTIPAGESNATTKVTIHPNTVSDGDRAFRIQVDSIESDNRLIGATSRQVDRPQATVGDVSDFQFTPDGKFALYLADSDVVGEKNLFRVPVGGGPAMQLNAPLISGGSVTSYQASVNGNTVLYQADQDSDNVFELYSVPSVGGAPTKLQFPLAEGDEFTSFQLSPDGSIAIVTIRRKGNRDVFELYRVATDGHSEPTKLGGDTLHSTSVVSSELSPDGSRVVFVEHRHGINKLHSILVHGQSPRIELSGRFLSLRHGNSFQLSPDGKTVFFTGRFSACSFSLYSVPIVGGIPTKLTDVSGRCGGVSSFKLTPDGDTLVYTADQETQFISELYSVSALGGESTKLIDDISSVFDVEFFQLSEEGNTVVFIGDDNSDRLFDLYSVSTEGGSPVKLNEALTGGNEVESFRISPDENTILYKIKRDSDGAFDLYSVLANGSEPIKLNGDGGGIFSYQLGIVGNTVVYTADEDADDVIELYSVTTSGDMRIKLSDELGNVDNVTAYRLSRDGRNVVYVADHDTRNVDELYSVSTRDGKTVKLNRRLALGGDVESLYGLQPFQLSADGSVAVYQADQETDGVFELYSVATEDGTPTKLNGVLADGGRVFFNFALSRDGSTVVYWAIQDTSSFFELYGVPASGGAPSKLSGPANNGFAFQHSNLSADGVSSSTSVGKT